MARSNCLFFALPRWLRKAPPGQETYLIFRRSRVAWGLFHCLHGVLDPETDQIKVISYKPPPGTLKTGFEPVFKGTAVEGDADTQRGDFS